MLLFKDLSFGCKIYQIQPRKLIEDIISLINVSCTFWKFWV